MSKMPNPFEDISAEVKHTADLVVLQALGSMDTYFDYLERTISSSPSGGTEFGEKLKTYAARNIAATHEFIKQLSRAKDFQDVVRIQTKFMQSQLKEFGEQTKSLGVIPKQQRVRSRHLSKRLLGKRWTGDFPQL